MKDALWVVVFRLLAMVLIPAIYVFLVAKDTVVCLYHFVCVVFIGTADERFLNEVVYSSESESEDSPLS